DVCIIAVFFFFFFQAEDGIRDLYVTGVQTCALPIFMRLRRERVRTGGVDHFAQFAVDLRQRARDLDSRAGIVGHGRVAMREAREDQRLADVRLADEQESPGGWELRHCLSASWDGPSLHEVTIVTRRSARRHRRAFGRCATLRTWR